MGSKTGKSEGFELSGVASSICTPFLTASYSDMPNILTNNFDSVGIAQGKDQIRKFCFFSLAIRFLFFSEVSSRA